MRLCSHLYLCAPACLCACLCLRLCLCVCVCVSLSLPVRVWTCARLRRQKTAELKKQKKRSHRQPSEHKRVDEERKAAIFNCNASQRLLQRNCLHKLFDFEIIIKSPPDAPGTQEPLRSPEQCNVTIKRIGHEHAFPRLNDGRDGRRGPSTAHSHLHDCGGRSGNTCPRTSLQSACLAAGGENVAAISTGPFLGTP